jgi:hypothetical protein
MITSISHPSYDYVPGDNSDPDGDSDGTSITIDLTDSAPPTPTDALTMHASDLDIKELGGPRASVEIHVESDNLASVGGAMVIGSWTASGPGVEYSCTTTSSGKCSIESGIIAGGGQTTFTIISISHPLLSYMPGENSDPDGDSDGTSISIDLAVPSPPTATPTPTPAMHVGDLDVKYSGQRVKLEVAVELPGGVKVGGATVIGTWTVSGPGVEYSCTTTASGKCEIESGSIPASQPTTFTITSVIHSIYSYNPWANSDPDGDSNGTSITYFP